MLAIGLVMTAGASAAMAQTADEANGDGSVKLRIQSLQKLVDKKLGYYEIRPIKSSESCDGLRARTTAKTPLAPTDGPYLTCDINVPGNDPVLLNAWIKVTGQYYDALRLNIGISGAAAIPNDIFRSLQCDYVTTYQTEQRGDGRIDFTYLCQGVVNPGAGEVLRVDLSVSGDNPSTISEIFFETKTDALVMKEPSKAK
jgi:hypothetical protein